jgi:superfamily II DNA/RNA helicase
VYTNRLPWSPPAAARSAAAGQGSHDDQATTAHPPRSGALGLRRELLVELTSLGYEEATPIQRAAIPPLLAGRDILGQAATGTGKTAAFALPILQRVADERPAPGKPLALVLVPTRELAVQVSEAFHRYGRRLGTSVVPIYGGQEFHRQIVGLRRGAHVVVATPGRALDHLRRETLDLSDLKIVALDEADEMLDMGFAEDLELILETAPETRQTALFSATLPPRIAAIAERFHRSREEQRLADRHDLRVEALLCRLAPERREIRRNENARHDLHVGRLERGDLGGEIIREELEAARAGAIAAAEEAREAAQKAKDEGR